MKKCDVCGFEFLQKKEERICQTCMDFIDTGYLTLVEVDPEKSILVDQRIKQREAFRTGVIVRINKDLAKKLLGLSEKTANDPFVFTDRKTIDQLQKVAKITITDGR